MVKVVKVDRAPRLRVLVLKAAKVDKVAKVDLPQVHHFREVREVREDRVARVVLLQLLPLKVDRAVKAIKAAKRVQVAKVAKGLRVARMVRAVQLKVVLRVPCLGLVQILSRVHLFSPIRPRVHRTLLGLSRLRIEVLRMSSPSSNLFKYSQRLLQFSRPGHCQRRRQPPPAPTFPGRPTWSLISTIYLICT